MLHSASPTRTPKRIGITCLLAALMAGALSLSAGAPTRADAPVQNGPIAYMQFAGDEAHVMVAEPDGSGAHELSLPQTGYGPSWSPDGTRLVVSTFVNDETIRPMIVSPRDGSTTIVQVPEAPIDLALLCRAWSPDGERLLCMGDSFSAEHPESNGVYSIRAADGSNLTRLTDGAFPPVFTEGGSCGGNDLPGSYSPDGSQFVFTRARCGAGPVPDRNQSAALFVAEADGGGLRQLTPFGLAWSHQEGLARWSPDGSRILFGSAKGSLFTIRPDGGHLKQIALDIGGGRSFAIAPDWAPDGSRIVFNLFIDGVSGIYTAGPDGGDLVLVAADGPDFVNEPDWGPVAP